MASTRTAPSCETGLTPLDEYAARKRDREATVAARERTQSISATPKSRSSSPRCIYTALRLGWRSFEHRLRRRRGAVRRAVDLARTGDARAGARPGGRGLLRRRRRSHPRSLDARRAERRAFPRSRSPVRRRPRHVRPAQPVPAALGLPHADGRGAAGQLAVAAVAVAGDPRAPGTYRGAARRASICASASRSSTPGAGDRSRPIG